MARTSSNRLATQKPLTSLASGRSSCSWAMKASLPDAMMPSRGLISPSAMHRSPLDAENLQGNRLAGHVAALDRMDPLQVKDGDAAGAQDRQRQAHRLNQPADGFDRLARGQGRRGLHALAARLRRIEQAHAIEAVR